MTDEKVLRQKFYDKDFSILIERQVSKTGRNGGHKNIERIGDKYFELLWFEPDENLWIGVYKEFVKDVKEK